MTFSLPDRYERHFQCEYDMEEKPGSRHLKTLFDTIYRCSLCGAGADKRDGLCSPEKNKRRDRLQRKKDE